ncbi:YceD family protein [Terrilactibacillus sp. S3-3]|nr:YceD family protein [Terrilactibacillus sp. S3-3]
MEVKGFVEFSKQSLTFHLWIEGTMVLPCALTLKDVDYPFHIHTSETFLLNASASINEADDEWVHEIKDDHIDLVPYIVEAILVEKPMRVVSEEAKAEPDNLPSGEGWELVTEKKKEA